MPFIKKGLKIRTVFVFMEILQPDLALRRDALEFLSKAAFPDAVLYILTEAM